MLVNKGKKIMNDDILSNLILSNDVKEDNDELDPSENGVLEDEGADNLLNRELYTDKSDRALADIVRMIKEGDLILQPDFQRDYIWNKKQASKFIESLLLGIPVPTIFLSENEDSTFEVIDGQQRLTSLSLFWTGKLTLTGLTTLAEYNGKKYVDLNADIKRMLSNSRTMSVIILQKESSRDVKFDVFQRINEGATKLSPQELRNVIYRGKLVDKIKELSDIQSYKNQFGRVTIARRTHQEIILRMLSINQLVTYQDGGFSLNKKYNGRINSTIISFLDKYRNSSQEIEKFANQFISNYENIYKVFGNDTFKLPNLSELSNVNNSNQPHNFEKDEGSITVSGIINRTFAEFIYILFDHASFNSSATPEKIALTKEIIYRSVISNIGLFQRATGNTSNLQSRLLLITSLIEELTGAGVIDGKYNK